MCILISGIKNLKNFLTVVKTKRNIGDKGLCFMILQTFKIKQNILSL